MCSSDLKISSKWLSHFSNDKENSEAYILEMLGEYLSNVSRSNNIDLSNALDSLNTHGGLNQALRNHMEAYNISGNLVAGLDGFRDRLKLTVKE